MITLDCGCEYTGKRPNLEDPALLAVAFWCPNGHEGMQGWQGTWPAPPAKDTRTATLVATVPAHHGEGEVRYQAPADQDLAGISQRKDGTWVLLAKGRAYDSVSRRAGRIWREQGREGYRMGWTIVLAKVAES